ncbi:MAG TPA: methyltransferase domain-containing protein [Dehalococcoidales bacterium]
MPHEFDGEAYKQSSNHQKEWGNRIIAEFQLNGNENILDLGCGDGALTSQLAELVPQGFVLGIDASRGMIAVAGKLSQQNLEFRLQDIDSMDYQEEFDLVFSNATLHWVKDHRRLLVSSYRCLKKNGVLRFNFGADGNCSYFNKFAKEAIGLPEFSNYFRTFEWPWYMPVLDEYEKLVKEFPFTEIKVWGEIADRYFPDKETLIKWVDQPSIVPFLESIPELEKPGFRDYVVKKMLEETLQNDGRCFETFRRINLLAKK